MKVTIEQNDGKPHTIIRKPFDSAWVREQLVMGVPVLAEEKGMDNLFLCLKPYWVAPPRWRVALLG